MKMHHYTDRSGYNGIRSTLNWIFKASRPPADHPFGAYFTTCGPGTKNLALRLRISREKTDFVFTFHDIGDLIRLRGQRGDFILYSPNDYLLEESRKIESGERASVEARPVVGEGQT
jgi:hypothetical protein